MSKDSSPLMDAGALAEMVGRDRAEWQQLVALLDAEPGTSMHGPASPDWNARDIYTHFARWLGHSSDDFEATLDGRGATRFANLTAFVQFPREKKDPRGGAWRFRKRASDF